MEAVAAVVVGGSMAKNAWVRWSPARLIALRHVLKMSPEQMAATVQERTGEQIAGNSIRRWESGRHAPNIRHLLAVCNAFEVDIGLFLEPAEPPPTSKGKKRSRKA